MLELTLTHHRNELKSNSENWTGDVHFNDSLWLQSKHLTSLNAEISNALSSIEYSAEDLDSSKKCIRLHALIIISSFHILIRS